MLENERAREVERESERERDDDDDDEKEGERKWRVKCRDRGNDRDGDFTSAQDGLVMNVSNGFVGFRTRAPQKKKTLKSFFST